MKQLTKNTILGFFGVFSLFGYADIKQLKKGGIVVAILYGSGYGLTFILPDPYMIFIGIALTLANVFILRKWTKEYLASSMIQ